MKTVHGAAGRGVVGVALTALVLSGGAVACTKGGSQEPKMTPAAAVAKAAKTSEAITSAHYRMTGTVPGAGKISAEAEMAMKPLAMSMKMTSSQADVGQVELRLVDNAVYVDGGAQAAKEMDGKHWLKFDMSALGGAEQALNTDQFGQANQNPAQESTFLTSSKKVKKVGTETVGGVSTTHYAGTLTLDDLRASLKDQDKAFREQREKSIEQYEKMGATTISMDMWVDGADQTKQFRMRSDTDKGQLDATITFLDFNKPVKVAVPPAKETADLAEMMKEAGQG